VSQLLSYLSIGLAVGAVYAFVALGYSMVYGVVRLINFAHGEVFMTGAFAGYFVLKDGGIDRLPWPQPWPAIAAYAVALLAGGLAAGLLAVVAERVCYRPLRRAPRITLLLTAVGLSMLLQNGARQAFGPSPREWPSPRVFVDAAAVPEPADAQYYVVRPFVSDAGERSENEEVLVAAGGSLSAPAREGARGATVYRKAGLSAGQVKLGIVAMLVVATGLLWFLVRRTRLGKAMRATSEDTAAAQLMGVNVDVVVSATFFLGAVLAGVGGVAYCAAYGNVDPLTGFLPGLKAFIAAVLGGIGSIPGAVVGGLLLGLLETLFAAYVSTEWRDALAFVVLVVILVVRPTGLLGTARREKV
jgi:branched-chain amino acid transport system permease protein